MKDAIIIGAGAAGLSAALWCDDLKLTAVVLEIESEIGGQLLRVYNPIENHLGGISAQNGRELCERFVDQIRNRRFELRTGAEIETIDLKAKKVFLKNGGEISAKALVLATGVRRRKLNVAGEDEFRGRGILDSGKRDSVQATGKIACVVGGGDAAAENALILAETASKVYLVHRRKGLRARDEFIEQIKNNPKIEILTETFVTKIGGTGRVETVELKNENGGISRIAAKVIVIRIGVEPNTDLFRGQIEMDDNGYVKTNANCETNLENVFAVGDVANPLAQTVSSAVGMGATAIKVLLARLQN